jgi:CRISPR/Cas system endoribonuclease Cas6 (RAMP superfamily)
MRVPERLIAPAKLLVNWFFSWSHLSIECFSSDSSHVSGAWSRQKGKYRHLVSLLPPAFSMERA